MDYFNYYARKKIANPATSRVCEPIQVSEGDMDYATARAFQLALATEKASDLTLVEEVNKQ